MASIYSNDPYKRTKKLLKIPKTLKGVEIMVKYNKNEVFLPEVHKTPFKSNSIERNSIIMIKPASANSHLNEENLTENNRSLNNTNNLVEKEKTVVIFIYYLLYKLFFSF